MQINLPFNIPFAIAITIWPFVLLSKKFGTISTHGQAVTLAHESIHLAQQKRWFVYGLGVGLFAWWFLYLLCLPVWKNPLRRKAETEAYAKSQGLSADAIVEILKDSPYWLS